MHQGGGQKMVTFDEKGGRHLTFCQLLTSLPLNKYICMKEKHFLIYVRYKTILTLLFRLFTLTHFCLYLIKGNIGVFSKVQTTHEVNNVLFHVRKVHIINRPGLAGAVLQTPSLLID